MLPARKIDLIVIHCSRTENGRPFTIGDIDKLHAERGYRRGPAACMAYNGHLSAIGYHWVIHLNGARPVGRHFNEPGVTSRDRSVNARSLEICLVGNDRFTAEQWTALADQVGFLCNKFGVRRRLAHLDNGYTGVCGHRDLDSAKSCPGFSVADWLADGLAMPDAHLLEPAA